MSTQVDNAFIKQFESEVFTAYQRMGSLLRGTVRTKSGVVGTSTTFQKVGKGSASQKSRHAVITPMNVDHSSVECFLQDWYAGDWVDKLDELKINIEERKVTAEAGAFALGRKTDELIIAQLDTNATYATSDNLSAITAADMTDLVTTMGNRDVPVGDGNLFCAVSWQVWNKLLTLDAFVRAEYVGTDKLGYAGNAAMAKNWLGVIWMPHSGLTIASNIRKCHMYHRAGIGHAIGADVMSDITWHGDRAAHFVNNMMSQGAKLIDATAVQTWLVTENA